MVLTQQSVDGIQLQGGTILGTTRGGADIREIVKRIDMWGVDMLYVLGGNGGNAGANAINEECQKMGVNCCVVRHAATPMIFFISAVACCHSRILMTCCSQQTATTCLQSGWLGSSIQAAVGWLPLRQGLHFHVPVSLPCGLQGVATTLRFSVCFLHRQILYPQSKPSETQM